MFINKLLFSLVKMANLENHTLDISLVRTIDESYKVTFGENLFPHIAEDAKKDKGARHFLIPDENTLMYAEMLKTEFDKLKTPCEIPYVMKPGEAYKNDETWSEICVSLIGRKISRGDLLYAVGGGVNGDTVGFEAYTVKRGVRYKQVPTSIMAMVDSSVGGKTAIDIRRTKNAAGGFKQPDHVYISTFVLDTLNERNWNNGFAEVIKYGVISKQSLLDYIEENFDVLQKKNYNPRELMYVLETCCYLKAGVVEEDVEEKSGARSTLNFGHTPSHPIETVILRQFDEGKRDDYWLHGEALAPGMIVSGKVAHEITGFPMSGVERIERILKMFKHETKIPKDVSTDEIVEEMYNDKKVKNGKVRFTLPKEMGFMEPFGGSYTTEVDMNLVREAIDDTRER